MKCIERKGNITVEFKIGCYDVVRFPFSNITVNPRSLMAVFTSAIDNHGLYILLQYIVVFHLIRLFLVILRTNTKN